MKKKISLLLVLVAVLSVFSFHAPASAEDTIALEIDGVLVATDVAPIVVKDRTLVPMRAVANQLGAEISWDGARHQASFKTAAYTVVFTIDSTTYTVNSVSKKLDSPAIISGDRTLVPLRAFAESIGAKVGYDSKAHKATVQYFTGLTGDLKIDGSTTVQPIMEAAAALLMSKNPGLNLTVGAGGSGTGIKNTASGANNIGMSSRELTAAELGDGLVPVTIADDGIAIIINPKNSVNSLTKEQAEKIFKGEIVNWKDVGGDNKLINIYSRETGSGTLATLKEMLLENKYDIVESAEPKASSGLIKNAVANDEYGIGFDSIGFVDSTVKAVVLEGIAATTANVANDTYPLTRHLYVLTKGRASGISARVIDFLRTKSVQQEIVVGNGYIAVPVNG